MFENLEILRQAQAMAAHAGARQSSIAQNIANADTPGYRPTDLAPFAEAYREAGADEGLRRTRGGHFGGEELRAAVAERFARLIPGATSPNGNGVSVEAEMMRGAEVLQQHELALSIYQNALGVLRTSLGRQR
ncbi:MAG: FlgB family protein [Paracoccaceae bacterium]|nr:FlgB family protein [Paracoccaceae bacterium]